MTVRDVTWMNASGGQPDYSAADLRLINSALLPISNDVNRVLGCNSGVVPAPNNNGLKVTHNGSDPGAVTVATGQAWIDGTLTIGAYLVTVEVAENFNVPAHGSVSRTDRVWIRARDAEVDGTVGSNRNGVLEYAAGDAGTGAPQAVPNHALLLAEVTVPVSGTPTATDKRLLASRLDTAGRLVADSTEQALIEPYIGMSIFRLDTKQYLLWDGTQWAGIAGTWAAFTPTWTASSTNPTLNNGTLVGRFQQSGKTVVYNIILTWGSSTAAGSGSWRFQLPVTCAWPVHSNVGAVAIRDSSASDARVRGARLALTGPDRINLDDNSGNQVGASTPWAWNTGDTLSVTGSYEAV